MQTTSAYFLHALHSRGTLAAEVLVKRKFKRGGRTLEPSTFLACSFAEVPPQVRGWESALQAA